MTAPRTKALPQPVRWEDELRACRECGIPTGWRTPLGSPVHHGCVAQWWRFVPHDDEDYLDALYLLNFALGPLGPAPPVDPYRRWRPIPLRAGPCSWCGQPGLGITEDAYFHCKIHMFRPYRWPPPGGQP